MKKKYKIEIRYLILIIIISLIITLLILSFIINDNRRLSKIESVLKDSFILIQKTIYYPFRYIEIQSQNHFNLKRKYLTCLKENKENLKSDLILAEKDELKRTLKELQKLLSLKDVFVDYDLIQAMVINRDVSGWFNTLTIDKGRKDGLREDMIAIDNEGLIGRIIKTTYLTSELKLITAPDLNNQISVAIINEEEVIYGLLKGYDLNKRALVIEDVIDSNQLKKGNQVITSGFSTLYPKGILIGNVLKIVTDEYGLSKIIYVKPQANFINLNFVNILKAKGINDAN